MITEYIPGIVKTCFSILGVFGDEKLLVFYAFIFKIVSSTGKLADKEKLIRFDEVASVIKLWEASGRVAAGLFIKFTLRALIL